MVSTLPRLPVLEAIKSHDPESIAVVHYPSRRSFTYGDLLNDVVASKEKLREGSRSGSINGHRIAFLVENGYDYIVTYLSILSSHAVALPLCPSFPANELRYILNNSEAAMLLSSATFESKAAEVLKEGVDNRPISSTIEKKLEGAKGRKDFEFEDGAEGDGGLMLYTSGTTSQPKGVLLPQSALTAQCRSLLEAWAYSPTDRLLHVLPLHHIHGLINALMTPLFAGATIEFLYPFNANAVWERLGAPFLPTSPGQSNTPHPPPPIITFLTAVPTIYNRLLSTHPSLAQPLQAATKTALRTSNLRLNISGSAALPTPTKAAWTELSGGNVLLERYGMTEVGMALSCGLDPADRVDGSVGWPLPSVEVRLVDTDTHTVIQPGEEVGPDGKERQGEIQLRGPTIFQSYWRNEQATASEFVADKDDERGSVAGRWFKTGDVAIRRAVPGAGLGKTQEWAKGPMYFISGRKSVDIIKTGGEKVSALEVERELLSLPQIAEAAVVGLPSEAWGQKVVAMVVLDPAHSQSPASRPGGSPRRWGAMDMRRALKDRLANYKIPQELKVLEDALPRNAMGKVNKKNLIKEVIGEVAVKA
ncbi:MAG: hypothetical protein M1825_002759 [Sarcosagium campestre]|nr:MAG: hypothetical protein M1825_002759 [Sarcosagium campestre]